MLWKKGLLAAYLTGTCVLPAAAAGGRVILYRVRNKGVEPYPFIFRVVRFSLYMFYFIEVLQC